MDRRGIAVRPHAKTHKSVAVARLQLAAGARGITVGTIGEAEVFAEAGIDDLFLAYPVWAGGSKGGRVRALHERLPAFRVGRRLRRRGAAAGGGGRRCRGDPCASSSRSIRASTGPASASPDVAVEVARAARDAGLEVDRRVQPRRPRLRARGAASERAPTRSGR